MIDISDLSCAPRAIVAKAENDFQQNVYDDDCFQHGTTAFNMVSLKLVKRPIQICCDALFFADANLLRLPFLFSL